jgi:hypothetical protein
MRLTQWEKDWLDGMKQAFRGDPVASFEARSSDYQSASPVQFEHAESFSVSDAYHVFSKQEWTSAEK